MIEKSGAIYRPSSTYPYTRTIIDVPALRGGNEQGAGHTLCSRSQPPFSAIFRFLRHLPLHPLSVPLPRAKSTKHCQQRTVLRDVFLILHISRAFFARDFPAVFCARFFQRLFCARFYRDFENLMCGFHFLLPFAIPIGSTLRLESPRNFTFHCAALCGITVWNPPGMIVLLCGFLA